MVVDEVEAADVVRLRWKIWPTMIVTPCSQMREKNHDPTMIFLILACCLLGEMEIMAHTMIVTPSSQMR